MTVLSATARAPAPRSRPGRAVVRGIITLVQEGRFQLEDAEGVRRLFVLAHDAPADQADLQALLAAECPVRVEFDDAEGLLALVARDLEPLAS
jgi:hypothetical protein